MLFFFQFFNRPVALKNKKKIWLPKKKLEWRPCVHCGLGQLSPLPTCDTHRLRSSLQFRYINNHAVFTFTLGTLAWIRPWVIYDGMTVILIFKIEFSCWVPFVFFHFLWWFLILPLCLVFQFIQNPERKLSFSYFDERQKPFDWNS